MRMLVSLLVALAATAGTSIDPSPFFAAGKIRVLILSGRNNHDWQTTTPYLAQILRATGQVEVRVTHEPSGLNQAALAPYQVLVSDYNGPRWGPVAEAAVENFVRAGGGFVATHAASYAFGDMEILGDRHVRTGIHEAPWPAYAEIIGARWSSAEPRSGHGKRHLFHVKWTDGQHPIAVGAGDGFPISDELYHNLRMRPRAKVLATAFDAPEMNGTGKEEPIAWTRAFGQGRVFYTALGHDTAALSAPGFTIMFQRAVLWAASVSVPPVATPPAALRVMVVTGGHDYEPSFYSIFDGDPSLRVRVNPHPIAYRGDFRKNTDVLVLYDTIQDLPEDQRSNLRQFVESGKGVVVLHHALLDFNSWEWWWRDVMAGRYLGKADGDQPASTYLHDVDIEATPVSDHPVLRGVPPLLIHDETYKHMWISKKVQVLLETTNPNSDGPLAWVSPYDKSRVVVIQLGHGSDAHRHPAYRQLVLNAIHWAAGR